ncbi:hypothetical protein CDAR_560761 [Caerostris darwini]|uniref:Uncharacterized protein n=1 Tax=Caerostris darwini TaxID=1538125 RepID=A0AAV4PBX9_9ARAC|nr:hypothetical protein CDAR_560671 [Caerostris darwini]GIX94908.1 hypothetical protein CDAR_560761 [Caerostris darwini]
MDSRTIVVRPLNDRFYCGTLCRARVLSAGRDYSVNFSIGPVAEQTGLSHTEETGPPTWASGHRKPRWPRGGPAGLQPGGYVHGHWSF